MNIDDKLQTLRAIVAETESKDQQTWGIVRGTIGEIEEELRTLRAEVALTQIKTMSESEFASWLGVSRQSLRRERIDHPERVKAIIVRGCSARYSTWHQVHAHEIFPAKVFEAKRKPGRKSKVISDSRFQIQKEVAA
jgi:DNA-binding XRE family transcriptional regulator